MTEYRPGSPGVRGRYRSVSALAWGFGALIVGCWVAVDAAIHIPARGDLVTVGVVVVAAGLVFAAMIRPVLVVGEAGLTIRNPLRTIDVPWDEVTEVVGGLSVEIRTQTRRFTVWAVPVSLRQRGRERRRALLGTSQGSAFARPSVWDRLERAGHSDSSSPEPERPWADRVVDELREHLRERHKPSHGRGETGSGGTGTGETESGETESRRHGGVRVRWFRALPVVVLVGGAFILAGTLV